MFIILMSALAGIAGTGVGGLVSVLFGNVSAKGLNVILSFAGGIMISIACFKLVPEAVALSGMNYAALGLVLGVGVVLLLHSVIDIATNANANDMEYHSHHVGIYHEKKFATQRTRTSPMMRSGLVVLFAIALHNLPEGIAIGAGGAHDTAFGISLAIIIALHCIPEGMAVASPLIAGGMGKGKAAFFTALSGAPTAIGGALGYYLGGVSDVAVSLAMAGAGGAMLYVVFGEIMPQTFMVAKTKFTAFSVLAGIVLGIFITAV